MSFVSPVTVSVANTFKRALLILVSVFVFQAFHPALFDTSFLTAASSYSFRIHFLLVCFASE